jgi:ATP-dependent helicase/nuclease subunit B
MLAEKWLIAPSRRVGNQWAECVARGGQAVVNLRVKTLKSLATDLAGLEMLAQKVALVSEQAGPLLIDQVFRRMKAGLRYLGTLPASAGLAETMYRSIQDIRLAGLTPSQVVPRRFEVSAKGQDLLQIMGGYLDELNSRGLVDYAGVLQFAIARLQNAPNDIGADVVVCPASIRLKTLEKQLLDSFPQDRLHHLPVDEPHGKEDEAAKADTDLDLLRWLPHPDLAPAQVADGTVEIFRAIGEVNEVREALRRLLANQTKLDEAELLYTDAQTYVPLIFETIAAQAGCDSVGEETFPATFADGIPTTYSRPGRLLSAWVTWIAEDFPQARLVRMIAEGLLSVPGQEEQKFSFARLASVFRGVGIGLGRDRYLPKLDEQIERLKQRVKDSRSVDTDDPQDIVERLQSAQRRLAEMEILRQLVSKLLDFSPEKTTDQRTILDSAKGLLANCARTANKTDNFALERLAEDIEGLRYWLSEDGEPFTLDAWDWLATLPASASILGSGPQPGRLHVANALSGGHSGRSNTFIVGLDDSRFPGTGLQDPLFLDGERRAVSDDLPTATGDLEEKIRDFHRLVARLRGTLTLSYSCRDLVDNRDKFPSPLLMAAYRIVSGNHEGTQEDFLKWMPAAISFAPVTEGCCLNPTEWWLWRLCAGDEVQNAERLVGQSFPHLVRGKQAVQQRASAAFTQYDGHVPQAGSDLDPTAPQGPVMSSSRLETVGRCPLFFFFQRGLGIDLPDELVVEPDRWLDPLAYGKLLHSVFEKFVRELVKAKRGPKYPDDMARLNEILDALIAEYRDEYPPPTDHAFQTQRSQLQQTARVFLIEEDRYCAENRGTPVYLESSFGLGPKVCASPLDTPDPVLIKLSDGSTIRACGRVDRIDRVGQGAVDTYAVWDYKSGSAWKYDEADPFRQGRVVQPALYIAMVAHRLRATLSSKAKVARFGFFFPGVKERGRRIEWKTEGLAEGNEILGQLVGIIHQGAFLATNEKEDCNYCQYASICGDAETIAAASGRKLENGDNEALQPIRELRNHG